MQLPQFEFLSGTTEEISVAWQMIYRGEAGYFANASYRLNLASAADPLSIIAFSSDRAAKNRVIVSEQVNAQGLLVVNFTLRAPAGVARGRAGAWSGNIQLSNPPHIQDVAIVTGVFVNRPT